MSSLAESLGFDSVWVWDHLLLGSKKVFPVIDSLTTLASIGARTSKLKLGTSVLIMALRNPIVLSKVVSTIQYLTEGRFILGVAAGWYEREFRAVGVNFKKRGAIFEESFQLLRQLLYQNDVSYSSENYNIAHATMEPKSEVPIPLLIGGYSDSVMNRVGKFGDGWVSYYYTPEGYADSWKKIAKSATENGRDPKSLRAVNVIPLAIAGSYDKGDKLAREFTSNYMDLPRNTGCTADAAIRGSVNDCIEQIRRYEAVGVQDVVFIPAYYDLSQVELAGKEILPAFSK